MMQALKPLSAQPGVELVMLSTVDGVPIASCGKRSDEGCQDPLAGDRGVGNDDALAAMALSWLGELQSSTSPLGWGDAERVLLRCARGSLILQRCRGAVLVIQLAPGVSSEEIRLPMAGAVARIERSTLSNSQAPSPASIDPPGALPSSGNAASDQDPSKPTETHQEKA